MAVRLTYLGNIAILIILLIISSLICNRCTKKAIDDIKDGLKDPTTFIPYDDYKNDTLNSLVAPPLAVVRSYYVKELGKEIILRKGNKFWGDEHIFMHSPSFYRHCKNINEVKKTLFLQEGREYYRNLIEEFLENSKKIIYRDGKKIILKGRYKNETYLLVIDGSTNNIITFFRVGKN